MSTTAVDQFERAVEISKGIHDRKSIARYSVELAKALLVCDNPNPTRAVEVIELGIAQHVKEFEQTHAWSILDLGSYHYWDCHRLDEAETAFKRTLAMNPTPLAKAYALRMLGRIHMNRGSPERATEYLEQSLAIYRVIDIGGGNITFTENLLLQAGANCDRAARQ